MLTKNTKNKILFTIFIYELMTTCTEDGDKQTTKAGTALYTKRKKEPRTTEEEMD